MSNNQKNKNRNLVLRDSSLSGRIGNLVFEKNNRIRIFVPVKSKKK